jgi:hypothetical protein
MLKGRGHDARTAVDVGMSHATDEDHLLTAARNGWTLVTNDAEDFILLHDAWHRWSREWRVTPTHSGILIAMQTWKAERLAAEVEEFLGRGLPLENRLYQWKWTGSWPQRPQFP